MDKRTPFRASLIAAALASVVGLANAAVTDNSGSRVNSNTAQCTGDIYGTNCPSPETAPGPVSQAPAPVPPGPAPSTSAVAPAPTSESNIAALEPAPTEGARTPAENGYVIANNGGAVHTVNGGCMTSNTGAADFGVTECGGILARAAPPPPVQAPAAQEAPREIPLQRITLNTDTTFGFDSAVLTKAGKDQLNNIVEAAKNENVARLQIHITGYTDRIGSDEYNLKLSQERADAVRQYLVDAGLPAGLISSEGRGKANPVVQCQAMKGETLIQCLRPNRCSEVEFAALERAEPGSQQPPTTQNQPSTTPSPQPWEPGTDTGTPR